MRSHRARLDSNPIGVVWLIAAGLIALAACGDSNTTADEASGRKPANTEAEDQCASSTPPGAKMIAAYLSSMGDVRDWIDSRGPPAPGDHLHPERPDDQPVAVCWYDGDVAKSPPPDLQSGESKPFNRFVLVVGPDGDSDGLIAGYRDNLRPVPPKSDSSTR